MKRVIQKALCAAILLSSMSGIYAMEGQPKPAVVHPAASNNKEQSPSIFKRMAAYWRAAKTKASNTTGGLLFDGMMHRAQEKVPTFLKGESNVDAVARLAFVGSVFYLGSKLALKNSSGFKTLCLGGLGYIFGALGIENITVQGKNLAAIAKQEKLKLGQYWNSALTDLSAEVDQSASQASEDSAE